jgi:hypothetical protein
MTKEMQTNIIEQLQQNMDSLNAMGIIFAVRTINIKLGWPLRGQDHLFNFHYHGISNFVNLNKPFPNQISNRGCYKANPLIKQI